MKSRARGRTMAHMHHMLAATAAVGCSRAEGTQSVTLTPLPTVPASATDTTSPPPLPPVASATFSAPPAPPPSPPDPSGYLVVDMLPAPARCLGLASAARSSARMNMTSAGPVLDLVVTLPAHGSRGGSKFTGTATTWGGGQVVSSSFSGGGTVANVRVKPASAGVTNLDVALGVSCGAAGNGTLVAAVIFANATVTLTDY